MSLDIQSLRHIVNHQNREFERAIHLQVLKVYIIEQAISPLNAKVYN